MKSNNKIIELLTKITLPDLIHGKVEKIQRADSWT